MAKDKYFTKDAIRERLHSKLRTDIVEQTPSNNQAQLSNILKLMKGKKK